MCVCVCVCVLILEEYILVSVSTVPNSLMVLRLTASVGQFATRLGLLVLALGCLFNENRVVVVVLIGRIQFTTRFGLGLFELGGRSRFGGASSSSSSSSSIGAKFHFLIQVVGFVVPQHFENGTQQERHDASPVLGKER